MRRAMYALVVLLVAVTGVTVWLNLAGEWDDAPLAPAVADVRAQVARGEYLARAGNCAACHTTRGGAPYAGGRGIETPFGTVFGSNLTPDPDTGIGQWTSADFWRAMHNGRSRDGRLLYPAFPYPNFTQVSREDSDAIFAYLRTVPPVRQPNREHALRFPYGYQVMLAGWRALFFRPGVYQADASKPAEWNRGAYLVRGLGHCSACHASRNVFGATTGSLELSGGLIPMQGWYAPSLASSREAGVADWDTRHVIELLKIGVSSRASVLGPMAEVIYSSTQYLSDEDLGAIAVFLKSLPQGEPTAAPSTPLLGNAETLLTQGRKIYETSCMDCHGASGEGAAAMFPALAGNRAVTMPQAANVIRAVMSGGYPPGTAGNPRPYGMPPYAPFLSDEEVASVVTFIRRSWGNDAAAVDAREVSRYRSARTD